MTNSLRWPRIHRGAEGLGYDNEGRLRGILRFVTEVRIRATQVTFVTTAEACRPAATENHIHPK